MNYIKEKMLDAKIFLYWIIIYIYMASGISDKYEYYLNRSIWPIDGTTTDTTSKT